MSVKMLVNAPYGALYLIKIGPEITEKYAKNYLKREIFPIYMCALHSKSHVV
jgi:hypothetical protein